MADTIAGVWRAYSAGNRTTPWIDADGKFQPDAPKDFITMAKENFDKGYITNVSQWTDDWKLIGQSEGTLANATFGYFFPSWSMAAGGQLQDGEGGEGGGGDRPSVDPEPLPDVDQMGGAVESGGESGRAERALQHRAGGAFAVGSRQMKEPQIAAGVACAMHQFQGCFQSGFDAEHSE